jgi:tetratricopeptide (TPR) repeat protein
VQLVSVQDGLTLWAARFDEQFTDIFTIEDSISAQVVRSLALRLSGEEETQLTKSHTASPEAFQLYIRGRYYWNQRTSSGLKRALDYAQQAIDIDPAYAQAYIGLADAYSLLGAQHGVLPPRESFPKARAAAVRALEIDPTLAEAYASLGFINCCFDWDWATSELNFRRAIDLKPNYATAHHWYGEELTTLGRFAEAVTQLQLARELDPLSLAINTDLAASYYYAREYDKSERYLVNLLELNPNFVRALVVLGRVYERLGRYSEAIEMLTRAAELSRDELATTMALAHALTSADNPKAANQKLEELLAISEHRYVSPSNIASIYAIQNNHELTYAWLDRAIQSRDIELIWLKVNPIFDTMRDEVRFKEIASRVSPLLLSLSGGL